ncbi:MAG: hypothetical protein LBM59_04095 [Ruminococcus sp.]|jgi:hypothetical protein|nr:hypothetical protein [Ruminococcus sp.]
MEFFGVVFDTLFNWLDLGTADISEITEYLTIGSEVMNIFSWLKLFLPMELIAFIFGITGLYWGIRGTWAFIKIIRGVISGNTSLFGMINRGE